MNIRKLTCSVAACLLLVTGIALADPPMRMFLINGTFYWCSVDHDGTPFNCHPLSTSEDPIEP